MVQRLTEKLGLDQQTAEEVADTLSAAKEQKRAIRQNVKSEAQALKSALDAGDEKGMSKALRNLESAKADMQDLRAETAASIKSRLTVEQQAKMTLHKLRKKQRAKRSHQRMQKNAR